MRQSKKHSPPGQRQHTFLVKGQVFVQLMSSCIWPLSSEEPECQLIMQLQCKHILGANCTSICFPKKEGVCAVSDCTVTAYPRPERHEGNLLTKSELEPDPKPWRDGHEPGSRSTWTSLAEPAVLTPRSFDGISTEREDPFSVVYGRQSTSSTRTQHLQCRMNSWLVIATNFQIIYWSLKRSLRCLFFFSPPSFGPLEI